MGKMQSCCNVFCSIDARTSNFLTYKIFGLWYWILAAVFIVGAAYMIIAYKNKNAEERRVFRRNISIVLLICQFISYGL